MAAAPVMVRRVARPARSLRADWTGEWLRARGPLPGPTQSMMSMPMLRAVPMMVFMAASMSAA